MKDPNPKRVFGFVRGMEGNENYIVKFVGLTTVAKVNFTDRDWLLAALNHFIGLPLKEQQRLMHEEIAAQREGS